MAKNKDPQLVLKKIQPLKEFNLTCGSLKIAGPAQPGPQIGWGTRVWIDGQELPRVKSIKLELDPDRPIVAAIEVFV